MGGKGRHLVAEKAATFHPEADIRTAVEAVRAREGQLPEITLADGRKDTLRAGGTRERGQSQPKACSSSIPKGWTAAPFEDLSMTQTSTEVKRAQKTEVTGAPGGSAG